MSSNESLLKTLVEVHSGPDNIAGVDRVQGILRAELEKLGFVCQLVANPKADIRCGHLLVGTLKGKSPQCVTFVTHADTLEAGAAPTTRYTSDGVTALGQGVVDDKGGQVVALSGIQKYLQKNSTPEFTLRFVSAPSEEKGSPGFQSTFKTFSEGSVLVLGFEPSFEDGSIIDSRKGNRWYEIRVQGLEAHSGRAFEEGVNAAHELIDKLAQIQKLTNLKKQITVNVGAIAAGRDRYNVVAGEAVAKVDVRFVTLKDREQVHAAITKILKPVLYRSKKSKVAAEASFEIVDDCPPMMLAPQSKTFVQTYLKILQKIENRKLKSVQSGGAADSCYMSREGLVLIDGLGATGAGMHTANESLQIASLETRSQALAEFLDQATGLLQKSAGKSAASKSARSSPRSSKPKSKRRPKGRK